MASAGSFCRGTGSAYEVETYFWSTNGGCSYLVVNSLGSLVGGKERAVSPLIELFSGMPMSRLGITQSALDLCGYAAAAPVSAVVSR